MCEETEKRVCNWQKSRPVQSPASTQFDAKAHSDKWAPTIFVRHAVIDAVTFLFGLARD